MRSSDNPFRTSRLNALAYRPQGTDWPALMERFAAQDFRGAFVGPEGRGKTAALEELGRRLAAMGWRVVAMRADYGQRGPSGEVLETMSQEAGGRTAVLLDSAEQFSAWGWLRFRRAARDCGALAIATHDDGRLPLLHRCQTSAALLRDLALELTGAAPEIPDIDHEALWRAHGGNLRNALLELYDRCADLAAPTGPFAADSTAAMR